MHSAGTADDDGLIRDALDLTCDYLGASSVLFYWVAPRQDSIDICAGVAVPTGFTERYRLEMEPYDPLQIRHMVRHGRRIARFSDERRHHPPARMQRYQHYLNAHGLAETLDITLWAGDRAFAGLGLLRPLGGPPLCPDLERLSRVQRLLERGFASHAQVRQRQAERRLAEFGLSPRERQVVQLICQGASNRQVAERMNIGIGTVKTYVTRIFDKLDVPSRGALIARLAPSD